MQPGDLVRIHRYFEDDSDRGTGIITSVDFWEDAGAPDRNFGVDVYVLWSDGTEERCDEHDLELIIEG